MKKIIIMILALVAMALPARSSVPSVQLHDMDGNIVNTSSLNNTGHPVLISFWATWCKPCLRELKAIHEEYSEWREETGVQIVIVSIDGAQDAHKVKPMVDGFDWEFDVLLDPNGDFKRAMNVQAVPHVFILDGKGNIVHNHSGYTDGSEDELYEVLKGL